MIRIILALLVVTGGFLAIQFAKKFPDHFKTVLYIITFLYGAGILYFTLLSRTSADGNVINLIPFYTFTRSLRHPVRPDRILKSILTGRWREAFTTLVPIRTAVLNILLFIPMGYLIPEWTGEEKIRARTVCLICLAVSGFIEIIQLATGLGWCDADDLICNVLGGLAGYAAFCAVKRRRGKET